VILVREPLTMMGGAKMNWLQQVSERIAAGIFSGQTCEAIRHSGESRNPEGGGELDSGSRPAALPGTFVHVRHTLDDKNGGSAVALSL